MIARTSVLAACLALSGCGALLRQPVPVELIGQTQVPGMPGIRAAALDRNSPLEADLIASFAQESASDFPAQPDGRVRYANLILSGGGSNGAFGAGLLNGWSSSGKRPLFKIVTGVSTGALMAPFAFLGAQYDAELRRFYTTTDSRSVFSVRPLLQILGGDSIAYSGPLAATIAAHVDDALLQRIAAEHRRGRRLYVGTTDLDAQTFVVWNLGAIAASGHPGAVDVFRRVMLASASIPVAFPPVLFEVEAGGGLFDEMHVDGGVGTRMFYSGGVFDFAEAQRAAGRKTLGVEELYVIHNGQLRPVPAQTPRTLRGVAGRSLETIGKSAALNDLFRIFLLGERGGASVRWITLPEGFSTDSEEIFDPVQMTRLFETGLEHGRHGPNWFERTPALSEASR